MCVRLWRYSLASTAHNEGHYQYTNTRFQLGSDPSRPRSEIQTFSLRVKTGEQRNIRYCPDNMIPTRTIYPAATAWTLPVDTGR
jgi:hypothetical protein